jgi:hypothetical protein
MAGTRKRPGHFFACHLDDGRKKTGPKAGLSISAKLKITCQQQPKRLPKQQPKRQQQRQQRSKQQPKR